MKDDDVIVESTPVGVGAFYASLKRNNKQIRDDRAQAIVEDVQLKYKRAIEDLEMEIKQFKRDQENMIDLSPASATTLTMPSDFNAKDFIEKDVRIGVSVRNTEIKLEIAKARYAHLFGGN